MNFRSDPNAKSTGQRLNDFMVEEGKARRQNGLWEAGGGGICVSRGGAYLYIRRSVGKISTSYLTYVFKFYRRLWYLVLQF